MRVLLSATRKAVSVHATMTTTTSHLRSQTTLTQSRSVTDEVVSGWAKIALQSSRRARGHHIRTVHGRCQEIPRLSAASSGNARPVRWTTAADVHSGSAGAAALEHQVDELE